MTSNSRQANQGMEDSFSEASGQHSGTMVPRMESVTGAVGFR